LRQRMIEDMRLRRFQNPGLSSDQLARHAVPSSGP
jgi:hypothetical protein